MTRKREPAVPKIRPPGRVNTAHTHGAAAPVETLYGIGHLREVMGVSRDVPIGRVCEDAVAEIERLRANAPPVSWRERD